MIEIKKPVIECLELNEERSYGKFVIEPLERAMASHWAIPCVVCCFHRCLVRR